MKSKIFWENVEMFGRKHRSVFEKTFLRLEENASAFEFKWTCVFGKVFLGVLRWDGE